MIFYNLFLVYRKGPKKYSQCALEKCEEEIKNLKALFHGTKEKDECSKKCNPENKKFHHLDEKEVKKIKQCYEENGCDPKKKFNHRNSTEFRKVEECVNEKCPDDKKKFKTTTLPTTPEVSTAI